MKKIKSYKLSFQFAFDGFIYAIKTQKNFRFHLIIAILVLIASLLLRCKAVEISILLIVIAVVITMELLNTSIETIIDLISPHDQPLAKIAKDLGAAAVMISAFISIAIGLLIFLPKILNIK